MEGKLEILGVMPCNHLNDEQRQTFNNRMKKQQRRSLISGKCIFLLGILRIVIWPCTKYSATECKLSSHSFKFYIQLFCNDIYFNSVMDFWEQFIVCLSRHFLRALFVDVLLSRSSLLFWVVRVAVAAAPLSQWVWCHVCRSSP